jgi:hypothetical protein
VYFGSPKVYVEWREHNNSSHFSEQPIDLSFILSKV